MNNFPLVSIVLPVYNGSDFLAQSIESCIAQSYQNWELIVVNDCSKDNSLEIAQNFASKDKRIRVVDNEKNLKLPVSLNRGFAQAKGEYYTWTSHDNVMHPEMLDRFVDYLEHNPKVGLVTADYTAIDEKNKELYSVALPNPTTFMPLANPVCYAFMYRSEVADTVGEYDANLFLIEDYDYWIRIWLKYRIGKIDEILYYTRVHGKTLTMERKAEIAKRLYEVRLHYFDAFDSALKNSPAERFKLYVSILEYPKGKEKRRLTCKFMRLSPGYFMPGYLFVYWPKKKLRRTKLFIALKKRKDKK